MTYQELVETIKTLPLDQRLSLLEVLTHSLQADMSPTAPRHSTLARARGLLRTDEPTPSDQDLEETYTDYLIDKYA